MIPALAERLLPVPSQLVQFAGRAADAPPMPAHWWGHFRWSNPANITALKGLKDLV
ncbi:MAG: hypothetical protein ABSG86_12090 [Thermoguttaceae bacterium]|jgi:hypothetical protein